MYKMLKVFDCQAMPDDVRTKFFEQCQQGNDCYVSWWPTLPHYQEDDGTWQPNEDSIVDGWLVAYGAEVDEKVLIKHWR
jgi:hypothetical protein